MGSVRFNKTRGTWFIDFVAANGQRMRQTIGPGEEGRRLARKVLAQREAEAQLGIHRLPAAKTPTFAEWAEDWLHRSQARLRPKTLELYRYLLAYHLKPAFGEVRLGAITRREVQAFLAERAAAARPEAEAPYAPKTVNCALALLRTILSDAVESGHLPANPAAKVKPLAEGEEERYYLQPDEIRRLLEVAEESWRTFYLLAVNTGLRRGELLALRWSAIDMERGLLYVRRSLGRITDGKTYILQEAPVKTRHSRRTVDFSEEVRQALLRLPAGDDPERDFVFRSRTGRPVDPQTLERAFWRHLTLAGLPRIRFHDLRHTHAGLLIAAGVHPKAIQARLGHASITTTLNTYGHLMPSAFEGIGERVAAVAQGNVKATTSAPNPADGGEPRPERVSGDGTSDAYLGIT